MARPRKYNISKEQLVELYVNQELGIQRISKKLKISADTIYQRLKEYKIPIKPRCTKKQLPVSKEKLYDLYHIQELSTTDIGKKLGASKGVIRRRMIEFDIPRRKMTSKIPWTTPEELKNLYIEQGLSTYQIADKFDITPPTVKNALQKWNIDLRPRGFQKGVLVGDRNPAWVGGKTKWKDVQNKIFIDRVRSLKGCLKCRYNKCLAALEFHHRDPRTKLFAITGKYVKDRDILKEEMRKCDVLCCNCHNELHFLKLEQSRVYRNGCSGKRRYFIDRVRKMFGCHLCGYNKCIAALEFHHRDPMTKKFIIGKAWRSKYTIEDLKREIRKCDILCSNCHNEIHFMGENGYASHRSEVYL